MLIHKLLHFQDDIKKTLDQSCEKLRKNIRDKCHKYVARYGDKIADLLVKEMAPKVICREIGLCLWSEQEDCKYSRYIYNKCN